MVEEPLGPPTTPSRTNRLALVLVVVALIVGLDLATKAWAWNTLREQGPITVIDHVLYFRFGFNTGSAFSLLHDAEWARTFFIMITVATLAYMIWLASTLPTKRVLGFVSLGLVCAGALGNLHDRLFRTLDVRIGGRIVERHGVVDFIQIYYDFADGRYWPIFNVADASLVCGVALLIAFMLAKPRTPPPADSAKQALRVQ